MSWNWLKHDFSNVDIWIIWCVICNAFPSVSTQLSVLKQVLICTSKVTDGKIHCIQNVDFKAKKRIKSHCLLILNFELNKMRKCHMMIYFGYYFSIACLTFAFLWCFRTEHEQNNYIVRHLVKTIPNWTIRVPLCCKLKWLMAQ